MRETTKPKRVSVLVLPESTGTPIHGMYETLTLVDAVAGDGDGSKLFDVEIVGPKRGVVPSATGLPLEIHRSLDGVHETDIVVMASMLFENNDWVPGRYPEAVEWLREMHARGANIGSACAGALLLAETGLLDGLETTTHWAFAPTFRRNFPRVRLRIDERLIVAGRNDEFIMAGAASSWQDLVLCLISRHVSPTAAQAIGKFLLYDWSARLQTPYVPFAPATEHGDAAIRATQEWLEAEASTDHPVDDMASRCGLPSSTFKRRFKQATGYSPLHYLQRLRVEEAKRLLERSDTSVDEVCWATGYEEPSSFRRLFKRVTSLTPSEYRRKFRAPEPTKAG